MALVHSFSWLSNIPFLKKISPEYSLEGLMLQLKLQYFGHLTHWKRPWCWERLKAGGEGDDRGGDGWMALLTKWMWVWASFGGWWQTGKPGVLQSKGLKRVRHDWVTELNWIFHWGFPGGSDGKDAAMWETRVQSLGWEDHLEKRTATHSSILAWRIPWTEEPGELQSMGLQRAGHDWATNSFTTFQYSIAYIYHIFFICLSVDEHLGCVYVLAIVNSAAMNIGGVHVSLWIKVFLFSRYMPRIGITGSYGNSIFSF